MSTKISSVYSIISENDSTDQHIIKMEISHKSSNKIITTRNVQKNPRMKFRVKFVPLNSNGEIDVFFASTTSIFVRIDLEQDSYNHRGVLVTGACKNVVCYKWQHLYTIKLNYSYRAEGGPAVPGVRPMFAGDPIHKFKFVFRVPSDDFVKLMAPKVQLGNDLQNLLKNGRYSDLVLVSSNGKEFKVHKNVVTTRSAVLQATLQHEMVEKKERKVDSPFKSEILQQILHFMYTDQAPSMEKISEELLVAADYYQLYGLISLCEDPLFRNVTEENCFDILKLACSHSAQNLKQMVLEFICEGSNQSIIKTEAWKKIKCVDVLKALFEFTVNANKVEKISVEQIFAIE